MSAENLVHPRRRLFGLNALLFALTVLTTTAAGADLYRAFEADLNAGDVNPYRLSTFAGSLWYTVPLLTVLGAHEWGHIFACRYYRVNASAPFFIPAPTLFGTFGAFIRIRSAIPSRRSLFDIGAAGPIAGFIALIPFLIVGLKMSRVIRMPASFSGLELGEPPLFRMTALLVLGKIPEGYAINMHPMAAAAWFGLIATALNLIPLGQLDGGHIGYSAFGRKSAFLSLGSFAGLACLSMVSYAWIPWTIITAVALVVFGIQHPRTLDDSEPLDARRVALALVSVAILMLSFTPVPLNIVVSR